jgi:poly-gamma-glutamate synthesis protein (capsule biosynthesis protein)
MKHARFLFAVFCLSAVFPFFFAACKEPGVSVANQAAEKPPEPEISTLTILAAGDNLIHDIIYLAQRLPVTEAGASAEESYNFDSCYEHIRGLIEKADIAFINQETVLGGRQIGHSGYPVFNTPQETGDALLKAGFDVVNHASNHVMDRGERAVTGTMDYWDTKPAMTVLGLFRTKEERETKKQIIEKNGIKLGFLSYTYGLNGFSLPQDKPWLVPLIDTEVMARELDALRPLCDLLIVSMHWGNEFSHDISGQQRELSAFLALHQADLVIGHHPHVTEPVEIITRPDGGKLVCYYSLGDFLSHTQSDWTPDTMLGALAYVTVKKVAFPEGSEFGGQIPGSAKSITTIEEIKAIPTVSHYGKGRRPPFTVYPLYEYTNELAALQYKSTTLEYLQGVSLKLFGVYSLNDNPFAINQ